MACLASAREQVAYRKHELAVVGLLAASVLGGLAVEAWHRRSPAVLDRLEAERPRLGIPARPARPPAGSPPRRPGAASPARPARGAPAEPSAPERPLDLNRATAAELTRLPGIGPRLASRILARREALGGRFATTGQLGTVPGVGSRRAERLASLITVTPGPSTDPTTERAPPGGSEPDIREPP